MHPCLQAGDILYLRQHEDWQPGDILIYRSPESKELVAHRFIRGIGSEGLQLRGDNCRGMGESIGRDFVLGRVVSLERSGEVRALRRRAGYLWLVRLVALLPYRGRRFLNQIFWG